MIGDAVAICEEAAVKLIARHPDLDSDGLRALIHALGFDGFEPTHSWAPLVEIAAAGVTRARALELLCADHGIAPAGVVALRDAPNDLPVLRWAGHGLAVANAHPAVLEAADGVAPSNEDDGVAAVLKRLLGVIP